MSSESKLSINIKYWEIEIKDSEEIFAPGRRESVFARTCFAMSSFQIPLAWDTQDSGDHTLGSG